MLKQKLTKIYRNRILIWDTFYLLIKYTLIRVILSDKKLLDYLSSQNKFSLERLSSPKASSFQEIINPIKRVLNIIYPNGNCLVLCLIKREILFKNGFYEPVLIGVKNSSQGLMAHAWLAKDGVSNYKIVYLLP